MSWRKFRARKCGFTLIEVLVAIMIFAILGGMVMATFITFLNSYGQTEDYTLAEGEINNAFAKLADMIHNAGLGLPSGLFDVMFAETPDGPQESIMSFMDGPITVATGDIADSNNVVSFQIELDSDGFYSGPELYYAWSSPMNEPVLISHKLAGGTTLESEIKTASEYEGYINYEELAHDQGIWGGMSLALQTASEEELNTVTGLQEGQWLTFPSFGIPLWFNGTEAVVAPGAEYQHYLVGGTLNGLEEIHTVKAARVRVENNWLVQDIYLTPPQRYPDRTIKLARNVAGVWFQFYPKTRILCMTIAAKGVNADSNFAASTRPVGWPNGAPDLEDGKQYRLLVRRIQWQIKN